MKELQDVVEAEQEAERGGKTAILATVVQVEGSAYRRPGARMLITEEGWRAGSLSGGCLESDLVERAWRLTDAGGPAVVTYNTTDERDALFGVGSGCRGIIRVLVERLAPGGPLNPVAFLRDCLHNRKEGVLATVFRLDGPVGSKVGARLLLRHDGHVTTDIRDADLAASVEEDACRARPNARSHSRVYPLHAGAAEVLLEMIRPPVPLVIFGAGHDAAPTVRLAKELGWHVTVMDPRSAYATPARFPSADAVLCCSPEVVPEKLRLGEETVALVMTHNYLQDRTLLGLLLGSPVRYVGLVGPKSRTDELLRDLQAEGITWTGAQRGRLFAPAGFDIGAEGPEGIALAILAEIQAVLAGRSGGFLRNRTGSIHAEGGSEQPADGLGSWARANVTSGLSAS